MYIDAPEVAKMTGSQRMHGAMLLSLLEREIKKERLQDEHPEWSEKRVMIELVKMAFLPKPLPKWLERQFMAECDQFRPETSPE